MTEKASPAQGTVAHECDLAAATRRVAAQVAMPVASHLSVTGTETVALLGRRATAWLDHSRKLATCRETSGWITASQDFFHQATADYAEFNKLLLASWFKAAQGLTQATGTTGAAAPAPVTRDMITFKESQPEATIKANASRRAA